MSRRRRKKKPPGMIGVPPSARGLSPIPADPAEHAKRCAHEWVDVLESYAQKRGKELGLPKERIGMPDVQHGIREAAAVHPHATQGAGVSPDGRIVIDSGVLNPELFKSLGEEALRAFEQASLRTRIDNAIAHEYEEHKGGMDHAYAVEHTPDTELPISHEARELARKLRDGERKAKGR
jgi:hypothetical protein